MRPQLKTLHLHRQSNEPFPNAFAKFVLIEDHDGNWRYHQYAGEVWIEVNDCIRRVNEAAVIDHVKSKAVEKLEREGECAELCHRLNQVATIGDDGALIGLVRELLDAL